MLLTCLASLERKTLQFAKKHQSKRVLMTYTGMERIYIEKVVLRVVIVDLLQTLKKREQRCIWEMYG